MADVAITPVEGGYEARWGNETLIARTLIEVQVAVEYQWGLDVEWSFVERGHYDGTIKHEIRRAERQEQRQHHRIYTIREMENFQTHVMWYYIEVLWDGATRATLVTKRGSLAGAYESIAGEARFKGEDYTVVSEADFVQEIKRRIALAEALFRWKGDD